MATKVIKFPVAYQPPVGEISSSVLWFFSQCLIYAGAALGNRCDDRQETGKAERLSFRSALRNYILHITKNAE